MLEQRIGRHLGLTTTSRATCSLQVRSGIVAGVNMTRQTFMSSVLPIGEASPKCPDCLGTAAAEGPCAPADWRCHSRNLDETSRSGPRHRVRETLLTKSPTARSVPPPFVSWQAPSSRERFGSATPRTRTCPCRSFRCSRRSCLRPCSHAVSSGCGRAATRRPHSRASPASPLACVPRIMFESAIDCARAGR